jgi:uncharacterized protein YehS (DUF1456 family)
MQNIIQQKFIGPPMEVNCPLIYNKFTMLENEALIRKFGINGVLGVGECGIAYTTIHDGVVCKMTRDDSEYEVCSHLKNNKNELFVDIYDTFKIKLLSGYIVYIIMREKVNPLSKYHIYMFDILLLNSDKLRKSFDLFNEKSSIYEILKYFIEDEEQTSLFDGYLFKECYVALWNAHDNHVMDIHSGNFGINKQNKIVVIDP